MASNWQKVKEELICAICQDLLNHPKILLCLHSFCTECLKEWSDKLDSSKRQMDCPLCRTKVLLSTSRAVEELPSHFSAIRLVEIVRLQEQASSKEVTSICQIFNEGENAVASCSECDIFVCEFCEKVHRRYKTTSQHNVLPLKAMSPPLATAPPLL